MRVLRFPYIGRTPNARNLLTGQLWGHAKSLPDLPQLPRGVVAGNQLESEEDWRFEESLADTLDGRFTEFGGDPGTIPCRFCELVVRSSGFYLCRMPVLTFDLPTDEGHLNSRQQSRVSEV